MLMTRVLCDWLQMIQRRAIYNLFEEEEERGLQHIDT